MATFTFDGTPSTTVVTITAGTGNLAQLYADIGNAAVLAQTGSPGAYVYTWASGTAANTEVHLQSGVTLSMSSGDTLRWNMASNDTYTFVIEDGAVFNMVENCTLTGDLNDTYENDVMIYGTMNCQGTSGNEVIIEQFDDIMFQTWEGNDPCDWDYVIIRNPIAATSANAIMMMLSYYSNVGNLAHTFHNITLQSNDNSGNAIYVYGDCSNVTFDNINIDNTYYAFSGGGKIKLSNSTIQHIYSYPFQASTSTVLPYMYSMVPDYKQQPARTHINQPKCTFDTCTFDDNYNSSTTSAMYYVYASQVKFKDCTFQNCYYGLRMFYGSQILLQGTTTFTSITDPKNWYSVSSAFTSVSSPGSLYHVQALTMTVYDIYGNAIPDATVWVSQSEGYEESWFMTTATGQVKDIFGDDPVFVQREEYPDTTYDNWSDSIASGRYHQINVYKEGYQPWSTQLEFTADRTVSAKLQPVLGGRIIPQG